MKFKLNQAVFVQEKKKKGIIKEFLDGGMVKVTYFDPTTDERKVEDFHYTKLRPWKVKIDDSNKHYYQVEQFQKAFNLPHANKPTRLSEDEKNLRIKLLLEEIEEYKDSETLTDDVDALIDIYYILLGSMVMQGIKPDSFFQLVHKANMAKLVEGKPIYREDGKVLKPKGWRSPESLIEKEIERQLKK